jgi:hypothetical protein
LRCWGEKFFSCGARGRFRWKEAPIGHRDEMKEFCELVDILSVALHCEHVLTHIVNVVRLPVVRVYEHL